MIALVKFVFSAQFIIGAIIGGAGMFIFKDIIVKLIEKIKI